MTDSARDAAAAAASEDWEAASAAVDEAAAARNELSEDDVPLLVGPLLDDAIASMRSSVDDQDVAAAGQAAIETARLSLDLELRYRSPADIDIARFDLWLAQLAVDAAAEDAGLVNGDYFALDYLRDRILEVLDPADLASMNLALEELLGAVQDDDYPAMTEIAAGMREIIAALAP